MNDLDRIEQNISADIYFEHDLSEEVFRQKALRTYMSDWPHRAPFYVRRLGIPAIVCPRASDTREVLTDPQRFAMKLPKLPGYEVFDIFGGLESVLQMDGERHARIRRLMNPAFSPVGLSRIQAAIENIVTERLDHIEAGGTTFDAMGDFASHLILRALLEATFQLNAEQIEAFERVHHAITLVPTFKTGSARPTEYMDAIEGVRVVIQDVIEQRRANPGNDFISNLITARDEGSELSDAELHGQINTICGGGLGATAASLCGALLTLCRHPEAFDNLKKNQARVDDVIEECLRLHGPGLFSFPRFATCDTVIGGTKIYRGMPVITSPQSASYDPLVFENPTEFQLDRKHQTLTFGAGEHVCIGASLAKLTMRIGLTALVRRMPTLRLADSDFAPVYSGNIGTMTMTALPMRFD